MDRGGDLRASPGCRRRTSCTRRAKRASAPWPSGSRPSAPPRWRSSLISSALPEPGPDRGDEGVDRLVGELAEHARRRRRWRASGPRGPCGCATAPTGGIIANVSISGPRSRSGCEQRGAVGLVAEVGAVDHDERGRAGTRGCRAAAGSASGARRGDLVGRGPVHSAHALEDLGARSHGQNIIAGVDLGQRVEPELHAR